MPSWAELTGRFKAARDGETSPTTPALPEGSIRLPDLTIGGKTPQQLEKALASSGFVVCDYAGDILKSRGFTTLSKPQTLSLVRIKVADLGLTGEPTTDEVYERANSLGFDLCPAEVGPQLRLAYKDQPVYEWLHIGMKQVVVMYSDPHPHVFVLNRPNNDPKLWLDSIWASSDYRWNPKYEFVFSLRK
jgi:hypothetical protein